MINLMLNGEPKESKSKTLDAAIEEFGFGDAKIATAVNGMYIPADDRDGISLLDGDQIEVLAPMQGG